jgi:colicin D
LAIFGRLAAVAGVVVEIDDFAVAAWSAFRSGGDPLADSLFRLTLALEGCAGMAGSDPAGRAWAVEYDAAARSAVSGLRAAANGGYRLAAMFAASARNYAAAESSSDLSLITRLDVEGLPGDASVSWPVEVPSAAGASGGGPPGWSLVQAAVGRVWPDGHQDRLRSAASGWRAAAGAVDQAGQALDRLPDMFALDRLPELGDMELVCGAASANAGRLADAALGLATACEALAAHLDDVHSAIEHQLTDLLESSLVIEGVGQLLSVVTVGAAEGPTQGIEAGRVSAAAARIAELIDEFSATVARVADSVPTLGELADTVTTGLQRLFDGPLVPATVTSVRALPLETGITDTITTTEMSAADNLGSKSPPLPADWPTLRIGRGQLEAKFKHAADFGVQTPRGRAGFDQFENALRDFLRSPNNRRIEGTYYNQRAFFTVDQTSRLMVMQREDGSFWSGWRLYPQQAERLLTKGSLGRG